jgi:hypothetical protein
MIGTFSGSLRVGAGERFGAQSLFYNVGGGFRSFALNLAVPSFQQRQLGDLDRLDRTATRDQDLGQQNPCCAQKGHQPEARGKRTGNES